MALLACLLAFAATFPIAAPNPRNAAADAVVEGSRKLGIEFDKAALRSHQPAGGSAQAVNRSGAGAWVDAQIQLDSDELGEPPAALREFLDDYRDAIWDVVTALEKDEPDWGPEMDPDGDFGFPFLPIVRLERVLVAAALAEEQAGNRIDAGRALEAAWSLGQSVSNGRLLITQLITLAAERMQVGAVRKLQAPPLQWLGRLASNGPWPRMLEAVSHEGRFRPRGSGGDPAVEANSEVATKAFTAITEMLEKGLPCDLAGMSDEQLWQPAAAALAGETNPIKRLFIDFYTKHGIESVTSALRRAARLEIDREMTLKVLELRLEKDGSRDGEWPAELVNLTSAVCPAATYAYDSNAGAIELRFDGPIDATTTGPVLPSKFRSRNPEPTPTPAPPPLTPTPGGGMIAPP